MHKNEPAKIKAKSSDAKIPAAAPVIVSNLIKYNSCLLECGQKQRNYADNSSISTHQSILIKKEVSSDAKLLRNGNQIL